MNDEVVPCFLQTLDGRSPQTFQTHSSTQRPAETAREDELIFMNANCKKKNVAILSLGSHLASLEEMNLKHSHRCQLKDSSSEMQHLALPSCQEAVLPFQCKCSMKVVIPQLPDSITSHRHKSASFQGGETIYSLPFPITSDFSYQHDFAGTSPSEYFLNCFLKILCIRLSALQNN